MILNIKTLAGNAGKKIRQFFIKHKPRNRGDVIRLVVLAIAVPVFLYSAGQLIYKLYRYVYEDRQMEKIVDLKPGNDKNPFDDLSGAESGPESSGEEMPEELPYSIIKGSDSYLNDSGILEEYEDLRGLNSDLAGWMSFPGFDPKPINYPIMYSGDNSFYLNRDFNKNDSYAGSLFFDGNNTPFHEDPLSIDRNYVIYGHAMRNKSMFGHLTDYWGNEASQKNTIIYIDLMNTRLEYEVISTFLCEPDFNYRQTKFLSDDQFLDYLKAMTALSSHDFGAELSAEDKIITLSTCYRSTRRTAIIAKLVRQIIYTSESSNSSSIDKEPVALPTDMPLEVPSPTPIISKPESSSEVSSAMTSNESSKESSQESSEESSEESSGESSEESSGESSGESSEESSGESSEESSGESSGESSEESSGESSGESSEESSQESSEESSESSEETSNSSDTSGSSNTSET